MYNDIRSINKTNLYNDISTRINENAFDLVKFSLLTPVNVTNIML